MLRERSLRALFAVCVVLRCTSLLLPILDDDEAWFSASAKVLRSPFDFYLQAPDNKPPGTTWFFWLFQGNPILARAGFLILIVTTALFLGWLAGRILGKAQWPTSLLFLIATAVPAPKLLAVTNEGLMLTPLCMSLGIWLLALQKQRPPRLVWSALSGFLLAGALLIKQTALFFLLPPLFAQGWFFYRKSLPRGVAISFALGLVVPLAIAVYLLHPSQFLFWNFTYASSVLLTARESLFAEGKEFFLSILILSLGLAPIIWASIQTFRHCHQEKDGFQNVSIQARLFLILWLVSGGLAVAAGWGIFLHYFLLILPPLCLCAGVSIERKGLCYLIAAYTVCCLFLLIPFSTAFWGTDLFYYSNIATKIQAITQPNDKVFLWGGNAIPLPLSHRSFSTRFVTSRFAAPPYVTPDLEKTFEQEFTQSFPNVFVDLHERGDNRFRLPVDVYPWLRRALTAQYQEVIDPALPWATLYVRNGHTTGDCAVLPSASNLRAQSLKRDSERLGGKLAAVFFSMDIRAIFRLLKWLGTSGDWQAPLQWDQLLRSWLSFQGTFMATDPLKISLDQSVEELTHFFQQLLFSDQPVSEIQWHTMTPNINDASEKVAAAFKQRGQDLPLALQSRAWWISFATVQLQPVASP
jgi:4-amino-4-deoxy-L-arabinose transferase-like glycosyltransferase